MTRSGVGRCLLRFGLAAALLAAGAEGAAAQEGEPLLTRAERLVDEGRFSEAREAVEAWWNRGATAGARAEVQTALWLRGILTVDPDMAELDFRRLVVEFPGGRHSDEALLRLARGAAARGDADAARRYLAILIRDYPGSPHRPEARTLLARIPGGAGTMPGLPGGGAPASGDAPASRGEGAEGRPAPDAGPPEIPRDRPEAEAPPLAGSFTVQLGAFSTEEGARKVAEDAAAAGLAVRIVTVRGDALVRVRVGAFRDREAARAEMLRIRELGLEATLSADREREIPVG